MIHCYVLVCFTWLTYIWLDDYYITLFCKFDFIQIKKKTWVIIYIIWWLKKHKYSCLFPRTFKIIYNILHGWKSLRKQIASWNVSGSFRFRTSLICSYVCFRWMFPFRLCGICGQSVSPVEKATIYTCPITTRTRVIAFRRVDTNEYSNSLSINTRTHHTYMNIIYQLCIYKYINCVYNMCVYINIIYAQEYIN